MLSDWTLWLEWFIKALVVSLALLTGFALLLAMVVEIALQRNPLVYRKRGLPGLLADAELGEDPADELIGRHAAAEPRQRIQRLAQRRGDHLRLGERVRPGVGD